MATDVCTLAGYAFECFQLDKNAPRFFGFAELLSGLALTMLVWTIADVRYKFRIQTAAYKVRNSSIWFVIGLALVVLVTDLCRYSGAWMPRKGYITPEIWQFILGLAFLATLSTWLLVAFLRPPVFNRRNAQQFVEAVQARLERGSASELTIVAAELARSCANIVSHATHQAPNGTFVASEQARKLLNVIATPRFCKIYVESGSKLVVSLFDEIRKQSGYGPEAENLARNVLTAAINNRNSFLYVELQHEELKLMDSPVINALCGDLTVVSRITMLLSPHTTRLKPWDLDQWRAYLRLVLEAFTTYVRGPCTSKPNSLHWAYLEIEWIYTGLNSDLLDSELRPHDDLYQRIQTLGTLINDMVYVLDQHGASDKTQTLQPHQDIAQIILSLIEAAARVNKPYRVARTLQATLIWDRIMNAHALRTDTGKLILALVHAQLLRNIEQCPNLDSAQQLGFCLNVLGFTPSAPGQSYGQAWRQFHIDVLQWTKTNIASLLDQHPDLGEDCFVEGMSYDAPNNRLIVQRAENAAPSSCLAVDPLS